jgi:UDP-GlcNAc:undecaprenyl-phosphate GlcNAc-1-phosphate transferase
MTTIPLSALFAFLVATGATPLVYRLALRFGALDVAGSVHRKSHGADIPRLGGIAIAVAFYAPIVGLLLVESDIGRRFVANPPLAYGMLGGGAVIVGLGIVDDIRGVRARTKFLVQFAVAIAVVSLGFKIRIIAFPSLPVIDGLVTFPLSVLWIVGLTNAMNLIDGLDGLAAGVGLFGLVPMIVTALVTGDLLLALICCTLAGALLGFLLFNFHPARIFMGDSGSMFLGFILALTTVQGATKGPVVVSFLAPVLALGLPIMDTLLAIGRRALIGQPLFAGDDGHIHHRLRRAGLSHRRTVLTMYAVAFVLAGGSLGLLLFRQQAVAITLSIAVAICAVLMRVIGYLPILDLGARLRSTRALRTRNRMLYAKLRLHIQSLHRSDAREGVSRFCEDLGSLIGARSGSLVLARGSQNMEPVEICAWGDQHGIDPAPRPLRLRVRPSHGSDLGVLEMIMGQEVDAGLVQVAEHGCAEIARALVREKSIRCIVDTATAAVQPVSEGIR